MGEFIRKVHVGVSVNMEPQATMRWREMRLVNRGTEMEVRTVTRRRDAFFKRRRGSNRNRRNRVVEFGTCCINIFDVWENSVGRCVPVSVDAQKSWTRAKGQPTR